MAASSSVGGLFTAPSDRRDLANLSALFEKLKIQLNLPTTGGGDVGRSYELAGSLDGVASENSASGTDVALPYGAFRAIPVLPQVRELLPCETAGKDLTSNEKVPVNLVDGPYSCADHYLDTHFRLVREDFVRPLKDAIRNALSGDGKRTASLRLYKGGVVETMWCLGNRISFLLKFDVARLGRVDWASSKRLMFGSLLILTCDNFQTIHLASVADRNDEMLEKGMVLIKVEWGESGAAADEWDMKMWQGNTWLVVESPGYFFATRYVLGNLQTMDLNAFPLSRCVLRAEGGSVPPEYLRFHLTLTNTLKLPGRFRDSVLDLKLRPDGKLDWPSPLMLGLDKAQFAAFQAGLTHELALIQGPPGTGKTFLGLKIVQTLLMNRCWGEDTPIFVVSYTNHALDQFLEGMLKFTRNVVRIGGQSRSQKMTRYSIREWFKRIVWARRRLPPKLHKVDPLRKKMMSALRAKANLETRISFNLIQQSILLSGAGVLNFEVLFAYVKPLQAAPPSPVKGRKRKKKRNSPHALNIMQWLGVRRGAATPAATVDGVLSAEKDEVLAVYGPDIEAALERELEEGRRDADVDFTTEFDAVKTFGGGAGVGLLETANVVYESTAMAGQRMVDDWYEMDEEDEGNFEFYRDNNPLTVRKHRQLENTLFEASITKCSMRIESLEDQIKDLEQTYEDGLKEMAEAREKAKGNRKKLLAVLRMQEVFDMEWSHLDAELHGMRDYVAREESMISALKSAIRLLRVPKGVELPPPKCGIPGSKDGLNSLRLRDRWLLYRYLVSKALSRSRELLAELIPKFLKAVEEVEACRRCEAVEFLRTMDIVGMTTTAASRDIARLKTLGPKIVVVEEAAEVFESSIITSLTETCQHLILIGDHKQLRPRPDVHELAVDHKMDVSMFERLVKNKFPHVTLGVQHRMRPEIADLIRPHIYRNLADHNRVRQYPEVPGVKCDLFFVTHANQEKKHFETKSPENTFEVNFLLALCQYLIQRGIHPSKITILTPYNRQIYRFSRTQGSYPLTREVKITTVDNFQGEENDVILLSLVRSNSQSELGFLTIANRINVALSRAKHGMFIVGNMEMLTSQSFMWSKVEARLQKRNAVGPALPLHCEMHPKAEFSAGCAEEFPEHGGCKEECGKALSCGHACKRPCHAYDRDHKTDATHCSQVVKKRCDRGLHEMDYVCGRVPDGKCRTVGSGQLPCGHDSDQIPCYCLSQGVTMAYAARDAAACGVACKYRHEACQHQCQLTCGHILADALENQIPDLFSGTSFHKLSKIVHDALCPECLLNRDLKGNKQWTADVLADILNDGEDVEMRLRNVMKVVKRNKKSFK